ncbi:hypothetical protein ANN_00138 [Periplaneta americana]|uniref:Uncharacterized protein n=1 Tax=Periplaneta americana TaxID=6978 RepID=A0ABQ8TRR8_PERAM|nr:hypothetical protein ANN_00138 [Periplaneta americana]
MCPEMLYLRVMAFTALKFTGTIPHVLEDTPLINRQHIHFSHDGAPAHFSRTARRYLDRRFRDRWIGRGSPIAWPPRSPNVNPLHFYLWGHLKSLVYSSPVPDLESLRNRIVACSEDIRNTPGVWDRVRRSMRHRYEAQIQQQQAQLLAQLQDAQGKQQELQRRLQEQLNGLSQQPFNLPQVPQFPIPFEQQQQIQPQQQPQFQQQPQPQPQFQQRPQPQPQPQPQFQPQPQPQPQFQPQPQPQPQFQPQPQPRPQPQPEFQPRPQPQPQQPLQFPEEPQVPEQAPPCSTQSGEAGFCRPLVKCITFYAEVPELRRQPCRMQSQELGVCCPLRKRPTFRSLIAASIRQNASYEVYEEVGCVSSDGSTRRAHIIIIDRQKDKGVILDPTIRFEMHEQQPQEVCREKQVIYEPCCQHLGAQYHITHRTVFGIMFGARGSVSPYPLLYPHASQNISHDLTEPDFRRCSHFLEVDPITTD